MIFLKSKFRIVNDWNIWQILETLNESSTTFRIFSKFNYTMFIWWAREIKLRIHFHANFSRLYSFICSEYRTCQVAIQLELFSVKRICFQMVTESEQENVDWLKFGIVLLLLLVSLTSIMHPIKIDESH